MIGLSAALSTGSSAGRSHLGAPGGTASSRSSRPGAVTAALSNPATAAHRPGLGSVSTVAWIPVAAIARHPRAGLPVPRSHPRALGPHDAHNLDGNIHTPREHLFTLGTATIGWPHKRHAADEALVRRWGSQEPAPLGVRASSSQLLSTMPSGGALGDPPSGTRSALSIARSPGPPFRLRLRRC